jgi:hypothetical protein
VPRKTTARPDRPEELPVTTAIRRRVRTALELEQLYVDIEQMVITLRPNERLTAVVAAKHKISLRTARLRICEVHARWRAAASTEDREHKRDLMRRTLDEIVSQSFAAGDLRAALEACKQLRALDGLDEAINTPTGAISISGASVVAASLSNDERRSLELALKGLS